MRVVCDTNILARSYPDGLGPSRRLLNALRDGPHSIIVSRSMLDELEQTLNYPHLRKRWGTTPGDLELLAELGLA